MCHRRLLLALVFVIGFFVAPSTAQAQGFCSNVIGMSVCDPAYPATWADCAAQAYYDDCAADACSIEELDYCYYLASQVWSMEYASASRDCSRIKQECDLIGGTINPQGGCTPPSTGGGGSGGGGGDGSGGVSRCTTEWIEIYLRYDDGTEITIWEGWATVCNAT